ncbi:MAG: tetratricopeptide repeat protein [Bacteroidales bacterium]
MSRVYNNMTSVWNIYFNGKENMDKCEQKIEGMPDDYLHEIPLFKSTSEVASRAISSDVEYTIAKATKLIKSKSITKKPKRRSGRMTQKYRRLASRAEYNEWVDDAHILLGKSFYYKHNFLSAYDYFSYVLTNFPEDETAFEAHIWMMRCDIELDRYAEADEKFKYLNSDVNFPKKYAPDLLLAQARSMLKQENSKEAEALIEEALELRGLSKQLRARLHYILAQKCEASDRVRDAIEHFEKVEKYSQNYTMTFNAKLSALRLTGGEDLNLLSEQLLKMLDKGKNNIFQDQVYFALGNIAMEQDKRDKALDYFKKSVAVSTDNDYQCATSCIKVAELYFDDEKYDKSFQYYDSAVFVMDESFDDFDKIYARYNNLDKLVSDMQIVARQDSLQSLANMPEAELYATIDKLIAMQAEKEQQIQQLGINAGLQRFSPFAQKINQPLGATSNNQRYSFYFYNPNTVAYGKTQFQQVWGRRKLEDNWRRTERRSVLVSEDEVVEDLNRENDPKKIEYYLQNIPLTDSLLQLSDNMIIKALNEQGQLYANEFENFDRAVKVYKELVSRFPNTEVELESIFAIYRIAEKARNAKLQEECSNIILLKYADSKYAQYIKDPEFISKHEKRLANINKLYKQVLYHYANSDYSTIPLLVSQIIENSPEPDLVAKLRFLDAVSEGKRGDWLKLQEKLSDYVKKYPTEETSELAMNIIALMQDSTYTNYERLVALGYINHKIQNKELLGSGELGQDPYGGKYSYDEELFHYFVLSYPADTSINENLLKFNIANYNIDNYPRNDFDIEEAWLNSTTKMILVKPIENKVGALKYFHSIIKDEQIYEALEGVQYINFVISSSNYDQIMEEHAYTDYLKFFAGNYSRFVGTNFSKEDVVKEEQKLINAEKDRVETEKGSYVEVDATSKAHKYTIDFGGDNYYVIAISNKDYNTSNLKGVLDAYNKSNYQGIKWSYEVANFDNYVLLLTKSIKPLPKALTYYRTIISDQNILNYLTGMSYRNFIISEANWKVLKENENVDKYMDFFQTECLPQIPASISTTGVATVDIDLSKNPYSFKNGNHYLDIVVPATGFDVDNLETVLKIFNIEKNADKSLSVSVDKLDDLRIVVKIGMLKTKDEALYYLRKMIREKSIRDILMSTTFRNFVISTENDTLFMKRKNITEYMDFYKEMYLKDSQ